MEFVFYKRRWFILLLLNLFTATNFYQHYEYTAISNVVSKFYNVSAIGINLTAVIFYLNASIMFYPMIWCIEKYGFRTTTNLAIFANAIGPCIKCFALRNNLYWLMMFGQSFPAFATITQPSLTAIFGANWFKSEHVATVIGTNTVFLMLGSSLAFLSPTLIFRGVKSDEETLEGLSSISIALASITSLLFVLAVVVIREKPPTPPSLAQKARGHHLKEQSAKVLLKNRSYMFLSIIFSFVIAGSQTMSVVLNQSIFLQFSHGNRIVTIAGILSLIPGIISSPLTGLICKHYKRYKRLLIMYCTLSIIFSTFYIISLKLKFEPFVYLSIFMSGFFYSGMYVIAMDFIVEVTYPFPEAVTVNITTVCACVPTIFIIPLTSMLVSTFGASSGNLTLLAMAIVNFILSLFIKEEMRRHKANAETLALLNNNDRQANGTFASNAIARVY
ncbi:putative MFS-type transporter C09D4.1-like protein [Dinothrombium tinctorium]|uniref:Putative MFS-type transporter C09D4.1-like protein n=1 Tax=Dinothrombium tinctorium TaxID=1965070 RepID=A0A3S3Q0M7_9ACAR|nr:putative MFS-type transporter C09D4.1-like protein [Dinothrombium tinctorium]RWS11676.1 putative MFS-type transporter C09D4.1-like protein [Dinothrombium tinctorium]RWS11860.1 putative MFS-type transporter C09D4.1-like protein [Dinothrombium tinctorium]RWS11868.1 putative MFS-type transporter C09D4.1-like protein [Dinothrombium tinctorium]